ncbi:MAG: LamG-like jellyroll fold domain-containing protein, partial [Candidatus Eiseniibacteriota bacterium]
AQIQSTINSRLTTAQSGLAARWALDEGTGTAVNGSAGTTINGAIVGSGSSWIPPAPFDDATTTPVAPTGLAVVANFSTQSTLTWTDNSSDESRFEIERSIEGSGGPFTAVATVAANTTTYVNSGLTPSSAYCYRVRAGNSAGTSDYTAVVCVDMPLAEEYALDLGSANAYVNFGAPASLQLTQLTLEMWMRRDGAGVGTNTGSGGIADAIPLLAKGRADVEVPANDINYLFGIQASSGVLCADFEEGPGGTGPVSLNHPILGTTPVTSGVWHHVAVTYDGTWKLYLDGTLDGSLAVNQPLGSLSTVAVSLGTALTQAGAAAGSFDGALDEVRIWNVARTQAQIQSTINSRLTTAQSGLAARWALDEGTGTAVNGSAGTTINGTIVGSGSSWIPPAPFDATSNGAPQITALIAPDNGATGVSQSPTLEVQVTDPDGDPMSVSFYGRVLTAPAAADFTLIGLPDTQYYVSSLNGGSPAIMNSQTQWIVNQRAARNIAYAVQLGDCVENGDNGSNPVEWQNADAALSLIENPVTTGMPEGMPYGVCVGNHDQSPIGDATGTTAFYNQYFGESRFSGRTYYGGHYGVNNNNWYDLFSASGMDFIVISMEYNTAPSPAVLTWADGLLTTYSNRRAIITTHNLLGAGNPGAFSAQGQAIYTALRGHSNVFLMLGGHVTEEGRRVDTYNGNKVYSVLSDYQARTNGGNGWLRIYEFSPANNVIRVRTFSPWLNQFEADADSSSQFTLPYDMSSTTSYALIGTVGGVASGGSASVIWPGLSATTPYQWYATASDAGSVTTGPVWNFTTGNDVLAADSGLPARVSLGPVSPNPSFNRAHVMLALPTPTWAHVDAIDIQGRVVATLADGTFGAGRHDITWSVTRAGMAPGLYFLRAQVGREVFVRRFTIIH